MWCVSGGCSVGLKRFRESEESCILFSYGGAQDWEAIESLFGKVRVGVSSWGSIEVWEEMCASRYPCVAFV